MSSKSERVADDAVAEVGQFYYWEPLTGKNGGSLFGWASNGGGLDQVGTSAESAICCFEYPMLLAARRSYLDQQTITAILEKLGKTKFSASSFATAWTKLWTDWPSFPCSNTYWRPRRGDLVFFAAQGNELNHVVLALGPNAKTNEIEVISFGERLENPAHVPVTRTTVDRLRQQGHTSVMFVSPPWY